MAKKAKIERTANESGTPRPMPRSRLRFEGRLGRLVREEVADGRNDEVNGDPVDEVYPYLEDVLAKSDIVVDGERVAKVIFATTCKIVLLASGICGPGEIPSASNWRSWNIQAVGVVLVR